MNNQQMLDFLMENDVILKSLSTKRMMTADEAFVLGGEFIVYLDASLENPDLYRGRDFDKAMKVLEGEE